jgi:hypothetical protein
MASVAKIWRVDKQTMEERATGAKEELFRYYFPKHIIFHECVSMDKLIEKTTFIRYAYYFKLYGAQSRL